MALQALTTENRRLCRQVDQLTSAYKLIKENHERTVKELRDAEIYIRLLEDEAEMASFKLRDAERGY